MFVLAVEYLCCMHAYVNLFVLVMAVELVTEECVKSYTRRAARPRRAERNAKLSFCGVVGEHRLRLGSARALPRRETVIFIFKLRTIKI